MNRLLAEAAELRGRLKAYEEFGVKPKAEEQAKPTADDPEPKQADFATEAEYNRALGRKISLLWLRVIGGRLGLFFRR